MWPDPDGKARPAGRPWRDPLHSTYSKDHGACALCKQSSQAATRATPTHDALRFLDHPPSNGKSPTNPWPLALAPATEEEEAKKTRPGPPAGDASKHASLLLRQLSSALLTRGRGDARCSSQRAAAVVTCLFTARGASTG